MALSAINNKYIEDIIKKNSEITQNKNTVSNIYSGPSTLTKTTVSPYNNGIVSKKLYDDAVANESNYVNAMKSGVGTSALLGATNALGLNTYDTPTLQNFSQVSSLDADIAKAKQRSAEKASTLGNLGKDTEPGKGSESVSDYAKQIEDAKKQYEDTISEIQAKYQGTGSGSSGYSGINGVDADIYNQIMTPYQKSQNVIDAENYLNQLRENFSGRTKYSDQLDSLIGAYQNRDKFSYDPNSDMLYQNYLAAMQNNGLQAMKDTMGQASALTGGYGSTYATGAANGAYNNYLQTANDNLTNFYNNALDAYNLEGQAMLNNINLLQDLDSTEYNRALQDYQMALNNADTAYERDYNNWQNSVANALNVAGYQNSDAWKQASMDADEKQRQEDLEYKQLQLALSQVPETETLSDYEKEMQALKLEEQKIKNGTLQTEWDTMRGIDSNGNTLVQSNSNSSSYSNSDMNNWKKLALEAYSTNGKDGLEYFLNSLERYWNTEEERKAIWQEISNYIDSSAEKTYTKVKNAWFGDDNDEYQDINTGEIVTYAKLKEMYGAAKAKKIKDSQ